MPKDLGKVLGGDAKAKEVWGSLTPLARNEFICWVITVKNPETRANHVDRVRKELKEGKRRPCCFAGCPHRNPNAVKYFKKPKKK